MRKNDAYLFYEAGQAVAAAHLGLTIRHVSGNPLAAASEIVLPRNQPKARMILWLTGMAAEKKGAGSADPLRRTRTRNRIRSSIESVAAGMAGTSHQQLRAAKNLLNQAQDRANAICSTLYEAIEQVVMLLRGNDLVEGEAILQIVKAVKARRSSRGKPPCDEPAAVGNAAAQADGDGAGG